MNSLESRTAVLAALGLALMAPAASWAGGKTEAQFVQGAESVVLDAPVPLGELPRLDCLLDLTEHVNDILAGGRDEPIGFQLDALFLVGGDAVKGARFHSASRVRILDAAGLTVGEIALDDRARKQGKKSPKRWHLEWDPRSAGLGGPLAEGERVFFESYGQGLKQKLADRAAHFCNAS
jgi:hypothetical protein